MTKSRLFLVFPFLLCCVILANSETTNVSEDEKDPTNDEGSSERESKQLWPLYHRSFPPLGPAVISHYPSVQRYTSLRQASRPLPSPSPRVGDVLPEVTFQKGERTPEEEKALVEKVNDIIGNKDALVKEVLEGRQGINGADIFADDVAVIPGRPNLEPIESLPLGGGIQLDGFNRRQECCLFVFFDGSAYYFDDYLRLLTGPYRLMYGTVNGHPHYVARGCKEAEQYGANCSYIWNSGYGWIIGIGTYIGQTKGVVYTRMEGSCPTDRSARWRYLNKDLEWKTNGNIVLECAS